jgi:hypothetical protein
MHLLFWIIGIFGTLTIGAGILAARRWRWNKKQRDRFARWNDQMNRAKAR